MHHYSGLIALLATIATGLFAASSVGQTPEQTQQWQAQSERAAAVEKARMEQLARERAARRDDPMSFVRTLNPMTAGGWEFRAVANDGSWATYSTTHQLKRSGRQVTMWLRQEYAEPQTGSEGRYSSVVQKVEYDCRKERLRTMLAIYYSQNNLAGNEATEEADPKTEPWSAIVPGTRDEFNFEWACSGGKSVASTH
jgi:hypothetical protein